MGKRVSEIDGIRGWAALVVVLFHLIDELFGVLAPTIRGASAHVLINGGLAVSVFFVLSGDALSLAYMRKKNINTLDTLLIKRYFRLTVPILLSCMCTYLLMKVGLTFNIEAAKIIHREDWLGAFIAFSPTLPSVLRYSIYTVYDGGNLKNSYNPFLWTMTIELLGSMLIILYLYVSERLTHPKFVIYGLIFFLIAAKSYYSLFFAGLLLSQYREEGILQRFQSCFIWKISSILILLSCVFILAVGLETSFYYLDLRMPVAIALVFCAYTSRAATAFFSSKFSRFLGTLSFPLYLVHFSIIISLTSYLIVETAKLGTLRSEHMIYIVSISTLASFIAAIIFRHLEAAGLMLVDLIPKFALKNSN
ncbi:acyltransferase family protein [Noviherbaspirillum pedocola]|uniref:Acyltransferase n=1 Tax=Noviherbaspirillum pedocola TaxID=2801341 RepID=A0A934SWU3_9BURK|nr:acyltransferase [Noviherbaspirillum pedocola]MBK4734297.1 acyltransferase [Noviherbaspirillum pedocola]